jgi:hypothetical protein
VISSQSNGELSLVIEIVFSELTSDEDEEFLLISGREKVS